MASGSMTALTASDIELVQKSGVAGYTPGAKDIGRLLALIGLVNEDQADDVVRALLRSGAAAVAGLREVLPLSVRPARGRLTALAGKLAAKLNSRELHTLLLGLVDDDDLKTRLNAINSLGRLPGDDSEEALIRLVETEGQRSEVVRAAVRALGKVGRDRAKAVLDAMQLEGDAGVGERAKLIVTREISRQGGGAICGDRIITEPREVWLSCREGLESLLIEEARQYGWTDARQLDRGLVSITHNGALTSLWALRIAVKFSFVLGLSDASDASFIKGIASPKASGFMAAMTDGAVRYRLQLPELSNAAMWRLVAELSKQVPALINDPTDSLWELARRRVGKKHYLELTPKGLADPRFIYRKADVPAASHPTIAAALARLSAVRSDDIVWDPFMGSGTELIECAKAGAPAQLHGTDLDPKALLACAANTAAAGFDGKIKAAQLDCLTWDAAGPTLIISNPPMGRRVHRGTLRLLFEKLVPKVAAQLATGGRLVWLTPLPLETRQGLEAAGLKLTWHAMVDLGGFTAELQRWEKH